MGDRRESGDSPRPQHRQQVTDEPHPGATRSASDKGTHHYRKQHRPGTGAENHKNSSPAHHRRSPKKVPRMTLTDVVDEATDGGLGTRQYHSTSHLSEMDHDHNPTSPGMKKRDFSMSHISRAKLTDEELRLSPRHSNASSRSGSPLRTIHHTVRIEKWDPLTDGDLNPENMMKKFNWQGFSHVETDVEAGGLIQSYTTPEIRKMGLVSGKVWVKMYGRRINLQLGDILEIPANQAHKAAAEDVSDAVLVIGTKESCCIA